MRVTILYQDRTITLAVISGDSYQTFFSDVISRFEISDVENDHIFALQDPISNSFVTSVSGIIAYTASKLELVDITQRCQVAISSLTALGAQLADDAQTRRKAAPQTKRAVFQLESDLKNDIYGEEFIQQGGMQPLVEIIRASDGNTQAYALKALSKSLCYLNGLEYMKYHPGLLDVLVGLTYETRNIMTAREALSLVFVICTYVDDGFDLVHRAIKRTALSKGIPPYSQLMRLLASGDLDAQINSLTLINVLLSKALSKKKRKKLALRLDSVGLLDILESQQNHIGHNDYLGQVERFEVLSGQVCSSSIFQLQALKRQVAELQSQAESAQAALQQIESNRITVDIIRRELYRYRNAVQSSFAAGVLINARAPIHRFSDQGEFTVKLQSISTLASQIESFRTQYNIDDQVVLHENEDAADPIQSPLMISSADKVSNERVDSRPDQFTSTRSNISANRKADIDASPDVMLRPAAAPSAPSSSAVAGAGAPPPPPCPVIPPGPGQALLGPQPTKPVIKPRLKMKPLHWKRVIIDLEKDEGRQSIWSMLTTSSGSLLNLDDVAEQFSTSSSSRSSRTISSSALLSKAMKTRVLSEKRSQAIAIMMSQLPNDFYQIKSAILQLDSNVLHPDHVQAIYSNSPTKEECDLLQTVSEASHLDRPERFLLMLCTIPFLQQRLSAWIFALNIDDSLISLTTQFEHIQAACIILTGSESLRFMLSIILAIGNYMNGGTNRGQADGFNLDILTCLDNSRCKDSRQTLLSYIAQVCLRSRPSIRSVLLEMAPVLTAHHAPSIHELNLKFSSLQAQANTLETDAVKVVKCDQLDLFQSRIDDALVNAKRGLTKLSSVRQGAIDSYNKALLYFTVSSTYDFITSPTFFDVFVTFLRRFHSSIPSEPKSNQETFSKNRRHAIGEKIGDGNMSDVIASIRKGHYLPQARKTDI